MEQYRQGDVFLEKIDAIPAGVTKQEPERRGFVLAEGEATGHAHTLDPKYAALYQADSATYLQLVKPVDLNHQEHGTVTLPPGKYRVVRQREYTPEDIRNVAD